MWTRPSRTESVGPRRSSPGRGGSTSCSAGSEPSPCAAPPRIVPAGASRRRGEPSVRLAGVRPPRGAADHVERRAARLVFALSAFLTMRPDPDLPPELVFQVTVPSLASGGARRGPPARGPARAAAARGGRRGARGGPRSRGGPRRGAAARAGGSGGGSPHRPRVRACARVRAAAGPRAGPPRADADGDSRDSGGRPPPPARPPAPVAPASVASRPQSAVEHAAGLSGNRPPAYPADARIRGEQGTVRIEIELDASGNVVRSASCDRAAASPSTRRRGPRRSRGGSGPPAGTASRCEPCSSATSSSCSASSARRPRTGAPRRPGRTAPRHPA